MKHGRKPIGDISKTLDALDNAEGISVPPPEGRKAERFKYRVRDITLEVPDNVGSTPTFSCQARNISDSGISLITTQFLYPGTKCRVKLVSVINHKVTQSGRIMRCRYLTGTARLHEIGIKFDAAINVSMFHHGTTPTRILLLCNDMTTQTLKVLIGKEHATFVVLGPDETPDERLKTHGADLVITDQSPEKLVEFAKNVRAQGIVTPMLALLSEDDPEIKKSLLEAGFDGDIQHPLSRESLRTQIAAFRSESLTSHLMFDNEMLDVIDAFVERVPEYIAEIRAALSSGENSKLKVALRSAMFGATSAGFEEIGAAINELIPMLDKDDVDAVAIRRRVTQILRLCDRATGASCKGG